MATFRLDETLAAATHAIGEINGMHYRLHENAQVNWFIIVPETTEVEFFRLPAAQQTILCDAVNTLSDFILRQFGCDKINIASIGNVVSQMHIHVIGRRYDDCYWPDVVWGQRYDQRYTEAQLAEIEQHFKLKVATPSGG